VLDVIIPTFLSVVLDVVILRVAFHIVVLDVIILSVAFL
jgi:hypothetical protein